MRFPIYSLALTSFALGTAEFAPNGMLLSASHDLSASVADTGLITTGFAVGATIGGPIIAALTARVPHKLLALCLTGMFLVANVVTAVSPGLAAAVTSRAVAGAMLGAFLGVAITIASDLVPAARRSAAIATVFLGFTAANVLGVVVGNMMGQILGWRSVFWLVSALSLVGLASMCRTLPDRERDSTKSGSAMSALRRGRLWLALLSIALGYGGLFVVFTYIAPLLELQAGVPAGAVPWFLLAFGVGLLGGTHFAGQAAGKSIFLTVSVALAVLIAGLVLLTVLSTNVPAVIVLLVVLGAAGFGLVPPMQSFVLEIAGQTSPVVSALAAAAFNAGVALGSAAGGDLVRASVDYNLLALVGAAISAAGLLVFFAAAALQKRTVESMSDESSPAPGQLPVTQDAVVPNR